MTQLDLEQYMDNPDYRRGVGAVIYKGGKVFFAERADAKGSWQLPQGGVDEGEDLLDAVRRELFEETGIAKDQVQLTGVYSSFTYYTLPEKFQKKGFKGQVHKWFSFEFLEEDSKIDLASAQDKEFSDWRWASVDEVLSEVEPFRKDAYEAMFKEFRSQIDANDS
ncbi:MAG: RNA pyrophosphohydrolase [Magnetococcales bacterium]|nr:RNA pyrophosphohydrolase [Magnetococcales bacterium]MEC8066370.1 RNA pyrophosphohydrolase [Pseudomonadota bacterium]|tara:strand:- start:2529 stop:3023 length:495 start_codon:yes stop_codon:yes gene_type:complete